MTIKKITLIILSFVIILIAGMEIGKKITIHEIKKEESTEQKTTDKNNVTEKDNDTTEVFTAGSALKHIIDKYNKPQTHNHEGEKYNCYEVEYRLSTEEELDGTKGDMYIKDGLKCYDITMYTVSCHERHNVTDRGIGSVDNVRVFENGKIEHISGYAI